MSCPDIENLIAFAIKPLLEENEEVACHIDSCRKCQNELRFINEIILYEPEITKDDVSSVKHFLQEKKKSKNLWQKLCETINNISTDEQNVYLEDSGEPELGFSLLGGVAAFAAVSPTDSGNAYIGEPVKIGFSANCSPDEMNYWYAEMVIPPGTLPEGKLMILLTDRDGNMIPRGTLVLLGNELPIHEGLAEISLDDFRNSLKNTNVFLRKNNGEAIPGGLVIC